MYIRVGILALFVWTSLISHSIGCINIYGTDLHGHSKLSEGVRATALASRLRNVRIDSKFWEGQAATLAVGLESADFKGRSDYAAALIYLKRYDEAIQILEDVERQQPGENIVAANLGTAYELSGNLEKAIEWIKKVYERNPESHGGSEWLHIRILNARIGLSSDPNWLKDHHVLGLDFGNDLFPTTPAEGIVDILGKSHDLDNIATAIEYQLSERLKFVPPQDPIVADLLFDLGNITAIVNVVEQATAVYEFAREYGVQDVPLLDSRTAHLKELAAANPLSGRDMISVISVTLGQLFWNAVLVIGAVVVLWKIIRVYRRRLDRSKSVNG